MRTAGAMTSSVAGSLTGGMTQLDTSEVRWFARGNLPSELVEQFCDSPGSADIEIRTDTYRLSPSRGVGLKRRNGGPLEVKIRQAQIGRMRLAGAVDAQIDDWRKIIGLNHPVFQEDGTWKWCEVEKVVVTRTYGLLSGNRVGLTERNLAATGCDVELAGITVGDHEAWTFALEAWGPHRERRRLLALVLAAHTENSPFPAPFAASLEYAMGYPEWLATVAAAPG
jgi:hypothetical protein